MNMEKFKTILLIGLIFLSIFLANQIWIEIPDTFSSPLTSRLQKKEDNYILSDVVRPEKYVVNLSEEIHTIIYRDAKFRLWEKGRYLLNDTFKDDKLSIEKIKDKDLNEYRNSKSIDYYFSEDIHINILSKMIDNKIPNNVLDDISYFNNIHINLGKEPFVIFSNNDNYYKISNIKINTDDIRKSISTIEDSIGHSEGRYTIYAPISYLFPIDNNIYLPADLKENLPNIELEKEILLVGEDGRSTEKIAVGFFQRNLDYVKKIVENNNRSIIYIYNEEILKIYNDGKIEYFNSLNDTVSYRQLNTSLNTAIDFISNHMGWPEGVYLEGIEHVKWQGSKGYKFRFSYKVGNTKTILNNRDNSLETPIEIEVYNEQVRSYKRYVHNLDTIDYEPLPKDKKMLSPINILQIEENYRPIQNRYIVSKGIDPEDIEDFQREILLSINDIYLAYYNDSINSFDKDKLIPVWVINIDNKSYVFDAYTGELVFEN